MIERWFRVRESGSSVRTECLAGVTTFLTMAYIVFVQPTVLSAAGMDFGSVMMATCLASGLSTLLMAFSANYPIALAPGMGHNFFFAYAVVIGMSIPWQTALGAVAAGGVLMIAVIGLRENLITAIPQSLKHAIAVGIGLLIAMVGLQWAGVIVDAPGTLVGLGNLGSPPVLLALFGLTVMAALAALRVTASMLIGILASALVGLAVGLVRFEGVMSAPPSMAPTFLQLDLAGIFTSELIPIIAVFFFLDLFDTVGTLVGVAEQAGFMKDGALPRARPALLTDAFGTVLGAAFGTSTITSYVESAAGVATGGRTGLASVVTALLFFVATLFSPLVRMIGGGYVTPGGTVLYPVVAPALVIVGAAMMRSVRLIAWDDATESIPAFLAIVMMPLTLSITEGIAFGFIGCSLLKTLSGRRAEVHWLVHVCAVAFVARYIFLR